MIVVHVLHDGAVCSTDFVDPRPWAATKQPPHGTIVTCGNCGKVGVVPDSGYEKEQP